MSAAGSLARINRVSALVLLVPSWLGLLGGWYWLLDLAAHFRWQYLIASALVFAWAAWQRHRRLAAVAAITFLLNVFVIGQLAWHPQLGGEVADDFSLRVLSLNVRTSNPNTRAVLEHVMSSDADLVLLMEVDQKWMTALAALNAKYPYRITEPRPDNFGIALFSRIPWTREEVLRLGEADVPSIQVQLAHQGRDFFFIGTHPVPPMGRRPAAWRDMQLRLLAEHVSQLDKPALVAGDLNATPWSAGIRKLTAGNLDFRSLDAPWTPTWRVRSMFAVPIDHALATAPLVITSRVVGAEVGSDHRPLHISISWAR